MATRCTHLDQARRVEPRTGHPLIRSFEPGQEWAWCYPDALPLKRSTIDAAIENAQAPRGGTGEPREPR